MVQKILGVVGWVGIAAVLTGMVARFVVPAQIDLWWWTMIIGLGLVAVYMLGQWRSVLEVFSRRQARYGTLGVFSVVLGLVILVAANWVLARQNKRWDLTAAGQYSLSGQTVRILESLESPIHVLVFAQELDFPRYRDRLAEYEYTSDQVTLEYIDVDKDPARARQYEVQSYGTVVFDYEGRVERVVSDQEQDLTNALIKAVEGEERKVYFLQGHGEREPTSTEQRVGYSGMVEALRRDNLSVETVILTQAGEVPADAAVLVIAGPSNDLLAPEIDLLRTYLENGGKMLVLLDPPDSVDAPNPDNLMGLLQEWGIEVGRNIVVDFSGVGQLLGTDAATPVAASYPPHPITDRFGLLTAFPLARSVTPIAGGAGDRVAESFIETSPRSWAEASLDLSSGEVALEEDQGDIPGPISIAVAVSAEASRSADSSAESDDDSQESDDDSQESDDDSQESDDDSQESDDNSAESVDGDTEEETTTSPPETRLVVFGDSDFASNGYLGIQGNSDLVLNAMNWLAEQDNLISIRPREPEDRRITLTNDQQFRIFAISLALIPALIFGSGVYVWWRRR